MKIEKIQNEKSKKWTKFRKAKSIIEYVIIFTVILVNAILIFASIQNPNKTPSIFGRKAFVIISGSMIPEIQIGDVALVKETDSFRVGDIIAFRRNSSVIVHRIAKEMVVNGNLMYQTKGDNNNIADTELVDISTIEGVYFGKIPFVGKIIMWMYNNLSMVIVIMIIILIAKYYITRK